MSNLHIMDIFPRTSGPYFAGIGIPVMYFLAFLACEPGPDLQQCVSVQCVIMKFVKNNNHPTFRFDLEICVP